MLGCRHMSKPKVRRKAHAQVLQQLKGRRCWHIWQDQASSECWRFLELATYFLCVLEERWARKLLHYPRSFSPSQCYSSTSPLPSPRAAGTSASTFASKNRFCPVFSRVSSFAATGSRFVLSSGEGVAWKSMPGVRKGCLLGRVVLIKSLFK